MDEAILRDLWDEHQTFGDDLVSVVADPWNLYHMKLSDFRITLQNYNHPD